MDTLGGESVELIFVSVLRKDASSFGFDNPRAVDGMS